jgi:hypothetical protein
MGTTTITPIATSAKMMANTVNVSDTALSQIKLRDGGFARHSVAPELHTLGVAHCRSHCVLAYTGRRSMPAGQILLPLQSCLVSPAFSVWP